MPDALTGLGLCAVVPCADALLRARAFRALEEALEDDLAIVECLFETSFK